jgi:hypothetical protein
MLITQALLRDGLGRLAAAGGKMNVHYREKVRHHVVGPQPGGTSLGLHAVMKSLQHRGLAVSLGYLEESDCLEGFQITPAGQDVLADPDHIIPPPAGAEVAGVGPPPLFGAYEQAMRDAGAVETIGRKP